MSYRNLWLMPTLVVVCSFAVLGYYGRENYRQAPPIPLKVVGGDDQTLMTQAGIQNAQDPTHRLPAATKLLVV